MKFSTCLATLATSAFALVYAQDAGISFTQPILGTYWKTGTSVAITWANQHGSSIDSIELRTGNSANLELVRVISDKKIDAGSGNYVWNIPEDLTTGTAYVLVAKSSTGDSYSGYFGIEGVPPGVTLPNAPQ